MTKKKRPTTKPPRIAKGYKHNFETLRLATFNNDLALVSAIRKADRKPVVLVCAIQTNADDNTITPIPLAVMVDGNPFELYEDPTVL